MSRWEFSVAVFQTQHFLEYEEGAVQPGCEGGFGAFAAPVGEVKIMLVNFFVRMAARILPGLLVSGEVDDDGLGHLPLQFRQRLRTHPALAAEESLAASKALYEEGISGMESEYAQYAEAKAILDACGVSRQTLTEEKAEIYEQLAQLNKQIRAERQKIKLCRAIADSAAVMQRDVTAQEKALHEKETEHSFTNRR